MSFGVLGPLEVREPGGAEVRVGTGKPAALLSALLVHANAWVSVDELIAMIWQEQDVPPSAERNLKTYVWRLRRALPAPAAGPRIESTARAYRIRVDPGELDVDEAQRLFEAAGRTGDPEAAAGLLTEALRLWRGRPYGGTGWAAPAVGFAEQLHRRIRNRLADLYAGTGRHDEAAVLARALVTEDPLREDSWTRLVLALHHGGRRAEALEAFESARAVLLAELGVEPGPALAAAHRRVLRGDRPGGAPGDLARIEDLLVGAVRAIETAVRLADRIGVTVPALPALPVAVGGVPA
ncbi:AfsR/SARP family transcriptional regulator [Amycolatopsis australiensis]|uniref:DNA-binding transcriptional activator of the SARP family n=1 Tax=Amycolatopsis australiensis TaxID=546364 RepID=A0A1K1S1Q2_9PSEU|nr:BTAD domain-containing putative transcriptional regulator [Amycolatopsis australiensis]SFW78273.1 DNA-binding transcriptional activator of the SARP family [Amycolatopsis australiensis]